MYASVTAKHNFGQYLSQQQVYLESTYILKVLHVKFYFIGMLSMDISRS